MSAKPAESKVAVKQPTVLASASNRLLLHQIDKTVPFALQNIPHSGNQVNSVAWSHNNMIIASCGSNSNQVNLSKATDCQIISQFEVCPKGIAVTDICFSSKSSQLAFCCDDASVGILNIRAKVVEVERQDHDKNYSAKSVSFNCYDNLICSGCSDGEIIVYQLLSDGQQEQLTQTKIVFRDKSQKSPLTMVKFSHTKRHVLASAYESGTVCIWDLQTIMGGSIETVPNKKMPSALRQRFMAHTSVCSGIAFSPVNNLLLCSAGLDNRIQFFDIVDGKEVKKIDAMMPLSCISFCADGHTIAVGAQKGGRVIIYDLKEAKKVKIELMGHDVSQKISSLQFAKAIKSQTPATIEKQPSSQSSQPHKQQVLQKKVSPVRTTKIVEKTSNEKERRSPRQPVSINLDKSDKSMTPKVVSEKIREVVSKDQQKMASFIDKRTDVEGEKFISERDRIQIQIENDQKQKLRKEKEEEEQKALKAVIEFKATKPSGKSASNVGAGTTSFTDATSDLSAIANRILHAPRNQAGRAEPDRVITDMNTMRMNIQTDFDKLKNSVENDIMADFDNLRQMFNQKSVKEDGFIIESEIDREARDQVHDLGVKPKRMDNVDMLDIEELEHQRDHPSHRAKFEVPQIGLTIEQKTIIDDIFEEKSSVFVNSIKQQFNTMHLELIRNFMQQETEVRGVLMTVASKNRAQKEELARLRRENQELRRINF